jgi:hypothetical protein
MAKPFDKLEDNVIGSVWKLDCRDEKVPRFVKNMALDCDEWTYRGLSPGGKYIFVPARPIDLPNCPMGRMFTTRRPEKLFWTWDDEPNVVDETI